MVRYISAGRNAGFIYRLLVKIGGMPRFGKQVVLVVMASLLYLFYPVYKDPILPVRIWFLDHGRAVVRGMKSILGYSCDTCFREGDARVSLESLGSDTVRIKLLSEENADLRRTLNFLSDHRGIVYVTTRVVRVYDGFEEKIFLPIGRKEGIREEQAVVSSEGLVGKITDVREHRSRVLLVQDKDFNIPVTVVERGVSALLSGSSSGPLLTDVSPDSEEEIGDGDLVITSGTNWGFPYGIYVGRVTGKRKVMFAVNYRKLSVISVVRLSREEQ